MAGARKRCTMQRVGSSVSAAGQGGKAGPQSSSSSNRSSIFVGDLADIESNATSTRPNKVQQSHNCDTSRDNFCYICSKFEVQSLRRQFNESFCDIYKEMFKMEVDQHNSWVPRVICNSCRKMLLRWKSEKNRKNMKFSSPTIWKIPRNREDCYFCLNNISGLNSKNKHKFIYKSVCTVIAPVLAECNKGESDSALSKNIEQPDSSESSSDENNSSESESYKSKTKFTVPSLVSQSELNDLVRDLGLPKDGSEFLASFLKKKKFLEPKTKVSFYRNRDSEFRKFFVRDHSLSLVFCTDVEGLINQIKPNLYKAPDWRLFIDSSKRSIKAVLLHNTNVYAPIPIAHSTVMEEKYDNMQILLEKIQYNKHSWLICGDLKIITMLLGQQSGFTKYPCYLCMWDSRDRNQHYSDTKKWAVRSSLTPGSSNMIHKALVDPSKILIPPLHIKLGLMKQFVKVLSIKTANVLNILSQNFRNFPMQN